MKRTPIVNGWYGDYIPSGDWCALILNSKSNVKENYIDTSYGQVQCPEYEVDKFENVLFLRIYLHKSKDGDNVLIAGQGSVSGICWLYSKNHHEWFKLGIAFATNPVYFFGDFVYVAFNGNTIKSYSLDTFELAETITHQIGVGGIRWMEEGFIATGDETYNGSSYPNIMLAEYTGLGNGTTYYNKEHYVGQSYVDGCIVVSNSLRKQLEPGDCKWLRAYIENRLSGIELFVTIVKQVENQIVFVSLNLNELTSLPNEPTNEPIPEPPTPDPPILPIPVPPDPEPPKPKPEFKTAGKYKMTDTKKVGLIMVDGKYIAFNPNLTFNNTSPDEFEMSQPDNLFQFKHIKTGLVLGADATQYSNDICKQLYLVDHRQGYESWNVEHPADSPDLISAFITFRRTEGINFSVKLRVVEL